MPEAFDPFSQHYRKVETNGEKPAWLQPQKISELPLQGNEVILERLWRRQEVLLIGGHSKSWKSWGLMDLMYCVASAFDWLVWTGTGFGKVLHIDCELFKSDIRKRFEEIAASYGDGALENIEVISLRGINFNLNDLNRLADYLDPNRYRAISIDPIYRILGGQRMSESDTGVVVELMNRAAELAARLNCGIGLLHHFSKGNQSDKRAIEAFSGTGVWGRAPDTCLTFREMQDEKCYNVTANTRSCHGVEPFAVQFRHPRFHVEADKDPDNLKSFKPAAKLKLSVDDLCSLIGSEEYISYKDLFARTRAFEITERTMDRRIKNAKDWGYLATDHQARYFLTASYVAKYRTSSTASTNASTI